MIIECFRSRVVVYLNNKHKVEYMDKIPQKNDKKLIMVIFLKQKGRTRRPFVFFLVLITNYPVFRMPAAMPAMVTISASSNSAGGVSLLRVRYSSSA